MKTVEEIEEEIPRILKFIQNYVQEGEKVVIPVSGGLDSDVVARLCVKALGRKRVRLFVVRQLHMENKFIRNVETLASELDVRLDQIYLEDMNVWLIQILQNAASDIGFRSDGLLDPARANCSLRTAIFSSYQDKGYLVAGNSNRTEVQMGFYMPFGDGLGHFKPIAHLYKSEVKRLSEFLGTEEKVRQQSPSAGFWEGEEDIEDMAYWLYNGGPVAGGKKFTEEDDKKVGMIQSQLSQEKIDTCLELLHEGEAVNKISDATGFSAELVKSFQKAVAAAQNSKNRPLMCCLTR